MAMKNGVWRTCWSIVNDNGYLVATAFPTLDTNKGTLKINVKTADQSLTVHVSDKLASDTVLWNGEHNHNLLSVDELLSLCGRQAAVVSSLLS